MMPINGAQWTALLQQQMQQIQHAQLQQQQYLANFQMPVEEDEEDEKDTEIERTLYCGNLDDRVDEELLYELFLQAGPLERVNIPKNRNFAFITYAHACSSLYAMHLFQGVSLFGKPLVIKYHSTTALPPLHFRHLPPTWGLAIGKPEYDQTQVQKQKFDNSSLRNSNLAAFMNDSSDNDRRDYRQNRSRNDRSRDHGGDDYRRRGGSPNRRRTTDDSSRNWTHGSRQSHQSHHSSSSYGKRYN